MGFVLSEHEAKDLIKQDSKNSEVLFPYLNGEDVNTSPGQLASRWIINFWDWPEVRAKQYAAPYERLLLTVKPERAKSKRQKYRDRWWHYAEAVPNLYHAVGRGAAYVKHPDGWDDSFPRLRKVLVCSLVQNYLKFSFVDNDQLFANRLAVFATEDFYDFSVLSSSIHQEWARKTSSTMRVDINYSPTDSFCTFPLPLLQSGEEKSRLRNLGRIYYESRLDFMRSEGVGLTKLYNLIHSPSEVDARLVAMRDLHRQVDEMLISLYGWSDLVLEHGFHEVPYLPEADRLRYTISEFARIEVLRRLSELNQKRYEAEIGQDLHSKSANTLSGRVKRVLLDLPEQHDLNFTDFPSEPNSEVNGGVRAIILDHLKNQPGWHSKADILSVIDITDGQWNTLMAALIESGHVERKGEKRGTRYRLTASSEAESIVDEEGLGA